PRRVEQRRAGGGGRRHDVHGRQVSAGRAGVVRVELGGEATRAGTPGQEDAGADGAEGVGVLQAAEVAQLVGGDIRRQRDVVGAGRGGLAVAAEEAVDVDDRLAAEVGVAEIDFTGQAAGAGEHLPHRAGDGVGPARDVLDEVGGQARQGGVQVEEDGRVG